MLHGFPSQSLTLLTDLYQLTMAYGYWRNAIHDRRAVFHLFFRRCPFEGQYAIAAGLESAVDWLRQFRVEKEELAYLETLDGNDGQPLFDKGFLEAIDGMPLTIDLDAMPEGTVVAAQEPLLRVCGPLWQCQWIESALLNLINFQTLIATKAARVCHAAGGQDVLEFGLRRAQGIDGAVSASRAAYIGGCVATSNLLAGKLLGIPVRGTHAHSWVMSFDSELEAFRAYAAAMPNNCVFLVDTYDTLQGVRHAIEVGKELRQRGHRMVGVRLDSGDLSELSIAARHLLDQAGFQETVIVASNDLDEHSIAALKNRDASIAVWGVGTNLVTGGDQSALGGVYKLGAITDDQDNWQPRIKLSQAPIKTSTPGIQQVRRYNQNGKIVGDLLYSELIGAPDSTHGETFDGQIIDLESVVGDPVEKLSYQDLLQPVMREGRVVADLPSLDQIREHALQQCRSLPRSCRSLVDANPFAVGLESQLAAQKRELIEVTEKT